MDEQYEFVNSVFRETLEHAIGETEYCIPDDIVNHFIKSKMKVNDYVSVFHKPFYIPEFITLDEKDDYLRWRCDMIHVPKKYAKAWNQYKFIEALPKHEQKSIGWFNQRNNFITASAGADAIDESKYNTSEDLLLTKLGLAAPFKENVNVYHGKKLEMIATLIYSHINNVSIGEFGMVEHLGGIPFLGASPDGICTNMTLDGKCTSLVGRMLEIKCVTFRKLNMSGPEHVFTHEKPDPSIIPHYYWIQMQLQLECCDLELCDFWQCKLKDYWSERLLLEGMKKCGKTIHKVEQGVDRPIDPRFECGTFIELMPKDVSNLNPWEKPEWFAKFIYPVRLDMELSEKIKWALYMKANWTKHYPQYEKDYKFGKILYFHLEQSHCFLVHRNKEWFAEKLPKFKAFWDRVLYYRNNPEKMKELIAKLAKKISDEEKEAKIRRDKKNKEYESITMDSDDD